MTTHQRWTAPDLDEYRTCIEFDRHVRELAEALVNDLRERLDPGDEFGYRLVIP